MRPESDNRAQGYRALRRGLEWAAVGLLAVGGTTWILRPHRPRESPSSTPQTLPSSMPAPTSASQSLPASKPATRLQAATRPLWHLLMPRARVHRENLEQRLALEGEVRARQPADLRSPVEMTTSILSVQSEGTHVKPGDVVLELSGEPIQQQLKEARMQLENAHAATVNARESLDIQKLQNESDLKAAQTNADLALLELGQFEKADLLTQRETLRINEENARKDLLRKEQDCELMVKLKAKDYVSKKDVEDARIALADAKTRLENTLAAQKLWKDYSEPRQRLILTRKCEQVQADLERTRRRNIAALQQRESELKTREFAEKSQEERCGSLQRQLASCQIKAPRAGILIYPQSQPTSEAIEPGASVRANQMLVQIFDPKAMVCMARVSEEQLDKVHPGQEAQLQLEAYPGKIFRAPITSVADYPDPVARRLDPNQRQYPVEIPLPETLSGLRPGLRAKVSVLLEAFPKSLTLPSDAIRKEGDQPFVFVESAGALQRRPVKVGLVIAGRTILLEGVSEGDIVLQGQPGESLAEEMIKEAILPQHQ